jgi:hypothetical protein
MRVAEGVNPTDGDPRVESNARLTGGLAALLLVLLAAEGATVLSVRSLLSAHVVIGMILVPPVLLKIASTGWRFVRYYKGDPAYLRKGPPQVVLRLLGPAVVILTVVLFGSGIALILVHGSIQGQLLSIHKVSFVLWFAVMTIHVLGHLAETARLAPADWLRRTRREVKGAGIRQWALVSAVVIGCILGAVMLGPTASYHRQRHGAPHAAPPGSHSRRTEL